MIASFIKILCAGLVFPVLVFAQTALPFTEKSSPGALWPNREFVWYYNPANAPVWLDTDTARSLVIDAALQWETCGVQMRYLGQTEAKPGLMDRRNVVGWSLDISPRLRGITLGQAADGRLLERDIAFRPDRKEFKQFPSLLKKVITHEFGHAIGLTHSSRCDDVMTLAADCPHAHPDTLPLTPTRHDRERCQSLYLLATNSLKGEKGL